MLSYDFCHAPVLGNHYLRKFVLKGAVADAENLH
jgi:hypothetical protein